MAERTYGETCPCHHGICWMVDDIVNCFCGTVWVCERIELAPGIREKKNPRQPGLHPGSR
eukprot:1456096-Amphidinium_carterae.1